MRPSCFLLVALLAAACVGSRAAPAQVCVLNIATTKLVPLNGTALASVRAALADVAKGEVVLGADPELGHTAAAAFVANAPVEATTAMCRALPTALPKRLPPDMFGTGISVSASMKPLLPSSDATTKATVYSCKANCKSCKNVSCCKNRGGCCYSWAGWLGCDTVKLSSGWKCKCPFGKN